MIVNISTNNVVNWNSTNEIEKTKNNILNLLQVRKGEIPFRRNVGISAELLDRPVNQIQGELMNEIMENIATFYPNVNVLSINLKQDNKGIVIEAVIDIV